MSIFPPVYPPAGIIGASVLGIPSGFGDLEEGSNMERLRLSESCALELQGQFHPTSATLFAENCQCKGPEGHGLDHHAHLLGDLEGEKHL